MSPDGVLRTVFSDDLHRARNPQLLVEFFDEGLKLALIIINLELFVHRRIAYFLKGGFVAFDLCFCYGQLN